MKLGIIDTETTGFSVETDSVIEVGIILFDTESVSILSQVSTLIFSDSNNAEHINKISQTALEASLSIPKLFPVFIDLVKASDVLVSHHAAFDKKWFTGIEKPWLCTMEDFSFPLSKSRKLSELALDHGVAVWKPHRALADCKLIADIFSSYSSEQLDKLVFNAQQPKEIYISLEEKPGTLSKAAGFIWTKLVPKYWAKKMRYEETLGLGFRCIEWTE